MATATVRPTPKEVKLNPMDLISLALMEAEFRQASRAIKSLRQRIAAGMQAGAKLTLTPADIRRLVREHNEHCARIGAGISIPKWLVMRRNGVATVRV
jgi:hypothetical protein